MRAILLLLAALWSPYVAAQAAPSVTYGVNGGTLVPGTLSDVGSGYRTWSNNDSMPGGARISDKHNVRFGPSANADVFSNRRVPWAGVGRALMWAGNVGLVIGAGSAIYDAWQAAQIQPTPDGWAEQTSGGTFQSTGVCYGGPSCSVPGWTTVYANDAAVINAFVPLLTSDSRNTFLYSRLHATYQGYREYRVYYTRFGETTYTAVNVFDVARAGCYAGGQYVSPSMNNSCPGGLSPISAQTAQQRLDAAAAAGAVRGGDVLREAVGHGYVVPLSDTEPLPATGPASVVSPPRTFVTTAPDGSTSSQSVPGPVYNITYNTNSYTYNVTNTSPTPDGGTVSETKEPEPSCGLPGQPACEVRIDETGTPSATSPDLSVFESLKTQDAQKVSEALSSVPEPSFGFIGAPPIVACRPVPLPNEMGEIDACNVVDTVRDLMGFLWALAAAWISLGWIREAVNGG